jgi:hypothetical protein
MPIVTGRARYREATLGGVPVDKYHVVVTRRHVASWEWEIYRNSEPLPARLRDGPYKSVRTAEAVGSVAPREFLQGLSREKKLSR